MSPPALPLWRRSAPRCFRLLDGYSVFELLRDYLVQICFHKFVCPVSSYRQKPLQIIHFRNAFTAEPAGDSALVFPSVHQPTQFALGPFSSIEKFAQQGREAGHAWDKTIILGEIAIRTCEVFTEYIFLVHSSGHPAQQPNELNALQKRTAAEASTPAAV